jgi:hypothetical protein
VLTGSGADLLALGLREPVRLPGPSLPVWVRRLAPYLDGRHTLAELTEGQPAGHAAAVGRVVTALLRAGLAVDTVGEPVEATPERLVAGDGDAVVGEAGLRRWRATRVRVADAGLTELVRLAGGRPVTGAADLVLHLAGVDELAGPVMITGVVDGVAAWLGPFGASAQWHPPAPRPWPAGVTGTVLRHRLVHDTLRQVAGVFVGTGAWLVRIDLDTLAAHRHPL